MTQKIWIGALALTLCALGAHAQTVKLDVTEHIQPTPDAPLGAPVVKTPAPFEQTIWRAGEQGRLLIKGPLAGYRGPVTVSDSAGQIVWKGRAKSGATEVAIRVSKLGLYYLRAGRNRFSFAVVPAPKPPARQIAGRTQWGVCTHFGTRDVPEETFKVLRALGVDAVRDEISWNPVEKEKGVYGFHDRFLAYNAMLKKYRIPLHFSASYGNRFYPQIARYPSAASAQPYADYVVAVLKKFGDNIISVEVLNEPNKLPAVTDYAPVLRATVETVRAAGFTQPIVAIGGAGPGGGGMIPGYARAVFNTGARSDGFSQHPYMAPFPPDTGYAPGNGPANLDAALTRAGNVVKDYDLQGSWITELGWSGIEAGQNPTVEDYATPNGARTMVSDAKQAAFTARTLLIASKYPHLKALYIYDFQDDGPNPLKRENRFGLVREDLQPKMSLQAFAIAKDFLSDKTWVSSFHQDNAILSANLYRDKSGDLWLAAWTLEITQGEVNEVIARKKTDPKAPLPPRHMDSEWHARFHVPGLKNLGGYDWQGAPLAKASSWKATSLPIYLKVGRDASAVGVYLDGVQQIIDGSANFPLEAVDSEMEKRAAQAEAKKAADTGEDSPE